LKFHTCRASFVRNYHIAHFAFFRGNFEEIPLVFVLKALATQSKLVSSYHFKLQQTQVEEHEATD